jgi:enoyl-CoA hydratase
MVNEIFPRENLREEVAKIAAEIGQYARFGLALTKQAFNFVEDLRGKRQAMDGVFHMHHLAHAHNQLMTGNLMGNIDAKAMRRRQGRPPAGRCGAACRAWLRLVHLLC